MSILTFKVSKRFFLKGLFKITRKYKQFEQATELVFISLSATRNNEYNKNYIEQLYFNTREFDFKMNQNHFIRPQFLCQKADLIDVGDGCWKPNALMTTFKCWC